MESMGACVLFPWFTPLLPASHSIRCAITGTESVFPHYVGSETASVSLCKDNQPDKDYYPTWSSCSQKRPPITPSPTALLLISLLPQPYPPPPREEGEATLSRGGVAIKNKTGQMCKLLVRVCVLDPLDSGST